jgi:spoIIIJ-associated protein
MKVAAAPQQTLAKSAPASPVAKPVAAGEFVASQLKSTDEEVVVVAVELLQGMLDRMGLKTTVRAVEFKGVLDDDDDERPLVLNIEGDDLGVLIGRRSETLTAIQYLLRLMVNHRVQRWINLEVDVEGYKARREDQLRKLAERMAERAVSSGRAVTLEAMPARERRIVHITLRNHPQVTTQSFGEGEHRKVSIIPK